MNHTEILSCFVARFVPDYDELSTTATVVKHETARAALETVYSILPAKFPTLYEQLVLSYRWPRSDVGVLRLMANPIGNGLTGLKDELTSDYNLLEACSKNGFIQFGFSGRGSYDPVCFDVSKSQSERIQRVVMLDHEQILCRHRIKLVNVLANSFKELALRIIRSS